MFQAPPPPSPPPPPAPAHTEMAYVQAASSNALLSLTKGKQVERAVIRYQLYVRTDTETRQPPGAAPDAPLPPMICTWTVRTYLEREPCFESLTGRLACAEGYTPRLGDQEQGSEAMAAGEEPKACSLARTSVAAATGRVAAALSAGAAARYDEDLKRRLIPEFAKAGVVAKPRSR